jgi:hypothetical protein
MSKKAKPNEATEAMAKTEATAIEQSGDDDENLQRTTTE